MEIEIYDLEVGDEILVLSQVPKYLKIIKKPELGKSRSWSPTTPHYRHVRAQFKRKDVTSMRSAWDYKNKVYTKVPVVKSTYILEPPEADDTIKALDLNYNKLWLIKRTNI